MLRVVECYVVCSSYLLLIISILLSPVLSLQDTCCTNIFITLSAESHYSLRVHEHDPLVCVSVLNSLSVKQLNLTEARYRLRTHNLIEGLDSTILTKSEA